MASHRTRHAKRRIFVLVAVLVVGAVVAVWLVVSNIRRGTRVEMVGDSVMALASEGIKDRLDWTERVRIEAHPGYRTDQLLPFASEMYADGDPPPIGVVLVGYNDLLQGVDESQAVDEMMLTLTNVECAIWVLLPTKGSYGADAAEAFNARVERLAERAGVHVEPGWRDAVDDTDDDSPDPELISTDGVHPDPAGSAELADVIDGSIQENCGLLAG